MHVQTNTHKDSACIAALTEYVRSATASPVSRPATAVKTSVRALVTGTANERSVPHTHTHTHATVSAEQVYLHLGVNNNHKAYYYIHLGCNVTRYSVKQLSELSSLLTARGLPSAESSKADGVV